METVYPHYKIKIVLKLTLDFVNLTDYASMFYMFI